MGALLLPGGVIGLILYLVLRKSKSGEQAGPAAIEPTPGKAVVIKSKPSSETAPDIKEAITQAARSPDVTTRTPRVERTTHTIRDTTPGGPSVYYDRSP